jgi:transposase
MKYIGIDMSKDTFHACFPDGNVEVFKNTREGITSFEKRSKQQECKKKETIIGIEATGVYHHLFCLTVSKTGWTVMIINPLLVSQMIRDGLRMVKNDTKDAGIIREATITR